MQDRSTLHRVSSNIDVQLEGDTATQRFPSLTQNEARALDQLLAHLDPQGAAAVIGLFGPPSAGKSTLLRVALEPAPARTVRTPEHRKVVGILLDAASTADDLQPWQSLLLAVIDLLTSNAMPGDRKTLNDLRNELGHAIRTSARDDGGAALALAAFTHHFRGAFPRLVQNVFGLSNAVVAVGIDHLDQVAPGVAAEWLEAASYFLNAPGCAVVFCADEAALVAKLDQSAPEANGQDLLRKWLTARVDMRVDSITAPIPKTALPAVQRLPDMSPAGTADVPPACMQIIAGALQPDKHLIGVTVDNWRSGMRAVVKRAEDGLHSSISSTAMAKLVTLRALSPQLFDAARYDARMLVALERQVRAGARPGVSDDWLSAVYAHPRLTALLAEHPELSSMELRDLATALRLAHTGMETEPKPQPAPAVSDRASAQAAGADESAAVSQTLPAAKREPGLAFPAAAVTTGLVAIGTFVVDRLAKLLATAAFQRSEIPAGSLIGFGIPEPSTLANTIFVDSLAVGAELFGVALTMLIILFWGGARPQKSYSIAFGLILGALLSNLFDRVAYGNILNFIHAYNLPVFNLSHLALLAGALLLAFSVLRNAFSPSAARTGAG